MPLSLEIVLVRTKAKAELGVKVEFLLYANIYCSIPMVLSSILISSGICTAENFITKTINKLRAVQL